MILARTHDDEHKCIEISFNYYNNKPVFFRYLINTNIFRLNAIKPEDAHVSYKGNLAICANEKDGTKDFQIVNAKKISLKILGENDYIDTPHFIILFN
jgi:hypothetical protein